MVANCARESKDAMPADRRYGATNAWLERELGTSANAIISEIRQMCK
jgi:hypothetical protein